MTTVGPPARAAARGDDVAGRVAPHVHRPVTAQQALDEGGALGLLARGRVDLCDGDPLFKDRVAVALHVGEGRADLGAREQLPRAVVVRLAGARRRRRPRARGLSRGRGAARLTAHAARAQRDAQREK